MSEPFTPEDVELVARADFEAVDGGRTWDEVPEGEKDEYRHDARAILAALAEAGRLLPAETRTEWVWDCPDDKGCYHDLPERQAREYAENLGGEALHRVVGPWLPTPAVSPVAEENPNPEVDHA